MTTATGAAGAATEVSPFRPRGQPVRNFVLVVSGLGACSSP